MNALQLPVPAKSEQAKAVAGEKVLSVGYVLSVRFTALPDAAAHSLFAFDCRRLLNRAMLSDRDLLQQYVDRGDQAAFTTLVQRHLNVVYRSALRRVGGDSHAADDVTQRVFTALARKASQLKSHASLAGWLYTSTRFSAAELVRGEQRRRRHEQEAQTMNELNAATLSPERLEPLLDEIMEQLPERDREAVLLHFFERRSFVEIAATFSSTADATRMRVNRALERMRGELSKKGVASTGAALAIALGSQSAVAGTAPAASTIASFAIAQASVASAGAAASVRLLQLLKSSAVIWTAAGVATLIIVGAGVRAVRSSSNRMTTVAMAPPIDSMVRDAPVIVPEKVGSLPLPAVTGSSLPAAKSVAAAPVVAPAFSSLTLQERNLLAVLWQDFDPTHPGRRLVIHVGNAAPNREGVEPLMARGWLRLSPNQRPGTVGVFLTNAAIDYCTRNSAEIDAFQPQAKLKPAPTAPQAPSPEKN